MYQPLPVPHHSRFCHQRSFVPVLRSTFLVFVSPLATLTFAFCLTFFTITLPDVMATSLFAALPFAMAVATLEEGILEVVWSGDGAGSFLAPVHVKRRVRMSEQGVRMQETGRTCLGGNALLTSLPLFLMQAIEGHRCPGVDQLEDGHIECNSHQSFR